MAFTSLAQIQSEVTTNLPTNAAGSITASTLRNTINDGMAFSTQGAVDFVKNFGAVGDGSTDNSTAWNAFNTFAVAESNAGRGVYLYIPPGTYNYDMSLCQFAICNIKKLYIIGYGAIIHNTYDQSVRGYNPFFSYPFFAQSYPGTFGQQSGVPGFASAFLINTTTSGNTSVTCQTPANASNFAVGDWAMVASLDTQYSGFPPNCDQHDYAVVTTVNAGTGVITLDRPVRYNHRSDFPDGGPDASYPAGKARIWMLNTTGWPVTGGKIYWDIDHTYEGLTVNSPPNPLGGNQSGGFVDPIVTLMVGRRMRTINWTGVGVGDSTSRLCEHYGDRYTIGTGEPDKNIDQQIFQNCTWDCPGIFQWQSSSVDHVTVKNCSFLGGGVMISGQAKHMLFENCDIYSLQVEYNIGYNRHTEFRNCRIFNYLAPNSLAGTSSDTSVDGTNVTFANGTFKILKSAETSPSVPLMLNWSCIPGQQIILVGPGGMFPGNPGIGHITSITEDATLVSVNTTLPYTALPSWATGNIKHVRNGRTTFNNCTGSDNARIASEANEAGYETWELFRYRFFGVTAGSGWWTTHQGILVRVKCNIIQTSPTGGTTLFLQKFNVYDSSALTAITGGGGAGLKIIFNVNTAGTREVTTTTYTGKQTGDDIQLAGASQSFLPNNVLFGATTSAFFWQYTALVPGNFAAYQLPIIELELQFDCGMFRRIITQRVDNSSALVGAVTGGAV